MDWSRKKKTFPNEIAVEIKTYIAFLLLNFALSNAQDNSEDTILLGLV